ncbi:MAG: hypothetical protein GF309_00830 [Candidatus Lokiarchaeota archaeon]|nr:hypothetical protein [Candidatus Lokiarchaeota archaeon]
MPISEDAAETLELLGFKTGIDHDSRALSLLRAMLKKCDETGKPISFTTAYEALLREEPSASPSKAWIHKVLKSLVDDGLVTMFGESAHRKSYLADAKSVMNGIEVLREKAIERVSETIDRKKEELEIIRNLDSAALAQEITEWITGRRQALKARFIKGIDEFYRVIDTTLYKNLKSGDVLRICILTINPFMHRFEKRISKMVDIARKGVEIKYAVPAGLLERESFKNNQNLRNLIREGLENLITLQGQGHKIDARFFNVSKKHYQFVAANHESMALIITEKPITGAWMSRRFNADLVDSAVESFDKIWNKSKSVLDIRSSDIESSGMDIDSEVAMSFIEGGKE